MRYSIRGAFGFGWRGCAGRRRARRGISLLEVLISIFVLSIGLLGVAAVLPVARHQMIEAAKADRGSACGQAALNDIKVRGALNLADWRGYNPHTNGWEQIGEVKSPWPPESETHDRRRGYTFGESYAVDPLYVAENPKAPSVDYAHFCDFPYNPTLPGTRVVAGLPGRWTRMQRVTWSRIFRDSSNAVVKTQNKLLAWSIFKWHDDLLFPVPSDETQRPEQRLLYDSFSNPLQSDFKGDYSWLATVTPLPEHIDFLQNDRFSDPVIVMPYSYPENSPLYTVSVAVFYKRDMSAPNHYAAGQLMAGETPGERQVRLEFLGGGVGGGDVRLHVRGNPADPTTWSPTEHLAVKKNEWLLVSGYYRRSCYYYNDRAIPPRSVQVTIPVGVHKWYRIVATSEIVVEDKNRNGAFNGDEIDSNLNGVVDPDYREVTLAGPDWNTANWCIDKGQPLLLRKEALGALFKGIVGVLSTDMKLY